MRSKPTHTGVLRRQSGIRLDWVAAFTAFIVLAASLLNAVPAQAALTRLSRVVVLNVGCVPTTASTTLAGLSAIDINGQLAQLGDYSDFVKIDGAAASLELADAPGGIYRLDGLSVGDHTITVPGYLVGSTDFTVDKCSISTATVHSVQGSTVNGTGADGTGTITLTVFSNDSQEQTCTAHVQENPAKIGEKSIFPNSADEIIIYELGAGTYTPYVTCQFSEQIDVGAVTVPLVAGPPTSAKPTVNCPKIGRVAGQAAMTVRCMVANGRAAYAGKLYRNGKLVRTWSGLTAGYVNLSVGYGPGYRFTASNPGGSSYDDFQVVYKDPSAWVRNVAKGKFGAAATHASNKVYWQDGKKRHGKWAFGKKHYLTKSGGAKTYLGDGPNVQKGSVNKVRVTINGKPFVLTFARS